MIGTSLLLAVTLLGAAPTPPRVPSPGVLPVHEGHAAAAEGSGTVNSVDMEKHKINISHAPIRALHWPSMTMDFPVNPEVDLSQVKQGSKVNFTLIRDGSVLEIHSIQPVAGK